MICITFGNGVDFCIDANQRMIIRKMVRGKLESEIDLGYASERHLDIILLHMGSLRIHTDRS